MLPDPRKLPLTDQLAMERTLLAAERTMLAYARTALGLIAAGTVVMRMSPTSTVDVAIGVVAIVIGVFVGLLGAIRFGRQRRRLGGLS